ncbi:MAG: glycosyl hydrolase family 28-related protein, partial [Pyrinomonadaceae bacterium]
MSTENAISGQTVAVRSANGHLAKFPAPNTSTDLIAGKSSNPQQLQAEIQDTGGQVYNVLAFGARGNGIADDTTAIQFAINAAANTVSGRGGAAAGTVFFPSRRTYKITRTLTWRLGVRLVGSPAFGGVGTSPSQLRWEGPVGGTLLQILPSSQDTDYVQFTTAEYLGFSGGGKAASLIVFQTTTKRDNRADFGTEFRYCTFDETIGDGIRLLSGAANFHIRNSRFDNIQGFAVYIDVNETPSFLTIDTITWDTGRDSSKPSKGFLYVAGESASNNTYARVRIANANMEVNVPLQSPKAIVYLGVNPNISNFRQHTLSIDNLTINPVSNDLAIVKLSSPADSKMAIFLSNVGTGSPGTRIIEGTSIRLPISDSNLIGNLSFAPLSQGTGAALNGYYGSLGIGTVTPSASLQIVGSSPDVKSLVIQQAPNATA